MNFDQILTDLKNKIYKPIYFLMGEETYYIDVITDFIADNVLSDAEKGFNQTVVYGKDTTIENVVSLAKRFPMMANQQVVIVKEAQNLKNMEPLLHYAQAPLKSTILVLCYKYKTLDKRTKLYKLLSSDFVLFDSPKIYDDRVPGWITAYLSKKNIEIDPKACMIIAEYIGNNLTRVANELDKLLISLNGETTRITAAHVEENIGISKEYNNFELTNALGTKNILKSNQIANFFAKNPSANPISYTIISLFFFFNKLLIYWAIKNKSDARNVASILQINPYFVTDYKKAAANYPVPKLLNVISILREYDVKSKGVDAPSVPQGELLKEMVYKILH